MDEDILRNLTEKNYQDIRKDIEMTIALLGDYSREVHGFLPPDLHSRLGDFLELRDMFAHQDRCHGKAEE